MSATNTNPSVYPAPVVAPPPAPTPTVRRQPPTPTIGLAPPPTAAYQGAAWFAFALGSIAFLYAVWYSPVASSDRYFLYTGFLFSCFGCVSVSKAVRDKQEGIPVSGLFYGLSYVAAITPLVMTAYFLAYDSTMDDYSHRGLLGMAYALSAFAVLTISKNERDKNAAKSPVPQPQPISR